MLKIIIKIEKTLRWTFLVQFYNSEHEEIILKSATGREKIGIQTNHLDYRQVEVRADIEACEALRISTRDRGYIHLLCLLWKN